MYPYNLLYTSVGTYKEIFEVTVAFVIGVIEAINPFAHAIYYLCLLVWF